MKAIFLCVLFTVPSISQNIKSFATYIDVGVTSALTPFRLGLMGELYSLENYGAYFMIRSNYNSIDKALLYDNISYDKAKYIFVDKEIGSVTKIYDITFGGTYFLRDGYRLGFGVMGVVTLKNTEFNDEWNVLGNRGRYYTMTSDSITLAFHMFIAKKFNNFSLQFGLSTYQNLSFELGFLVEIKSYNPEIVKDWD